MHKIIDEHIALQLGRHRHLTIRLAILYDIVVQVHDHLMSSQPRPQDIGKLVHRWVINIDVDLALREEREIVVEPADPRGYYVTELQHFRLNDFAGHELVNEPHAPRQLGENSSVSDDLP